jgi:hypothetical protein
MKKGELRATIRVYPDRTVAHNSLADALTRKGERDNALAEYLTALRLRPSGQSAVTLRVLATRFVSLRSGSTGLTRAEPCNPPLKPHSQLTG